MPDMMIQKPNTAQYIQQGTNNIASIIQNLPTMLQQDEQYKMAMAGYQSKEQANGDLYNTTKAAAQSAGLKNPPRAPYAGEDPASYQTEIARYLAGNAPTNKQGLPDTGFMKQFQELARATGTMSLDPVKEQMGSMQQQQQREAYVQRYGGDSMAQPAPQSSQAFSMAPQQEDTTGLQGALSGIRSPAAAGADAMAPKPVIQQPGPVPQQKREPGSISNAGQDYIDEMQKIALERARSGMGDPNDLFQTQAKIEEAKYGLELKKMEIEKEQIKAYQTYLASIADKRDVTTGSGGSVMTFQDFKNANFNVGDILPPEKRPGGGGGSGSFSNTPAGAEEKLSKAMALKLQNQFPDDYTEIGKDIFGQPIMKVVPNSKAAAIEANQETWRNMAQQWFPELAKQANLQTPPPPASDFTPPGNSGSQQSRENPKAYFKTIAEAESAKQAGFLQEGDWIYILEKRDTVQVGNPEASPSLSVFNPKPAISNPAAQQGAASSAGQAGASNGTFANEAAARAAGKRSGDAVYLDGIGLVRLK